MSIFIYDLVRLFALLWVLPLLAPPQAESGPAFPLLVYTAPNVLFLLAAFFLLVRFEEYRSYAYLYMAGKAVAVAANLGWFFFSLRTLAPALAEYALGTLFVLGFLLFLACLDALSVLGMSVLVIHRLGKPEAEGTAAADYRTPEGLGPERPGDADSLPSDRAGPQAVNPAMSAGMEE